jgi:hypothetical protein
MLGLRSVHTSLVEQAMSASAPALLNSTSRQIANFKKHAAESSKIESRRLIQ